ncbi:MAG: GNAT family N-acetyltransferase [Thermodesulfobacteriota bacterium]
MRHDKKEEPAMSLEPVSIKDAELVADILGRAFMDDPVMNYIQPDRSFIPRYFKAAFIKHYASHGLSRVMPDHTGAALWLPPGVGTRFPPLFFALAWTRRHLGKKNGLRMIMRANRLLHHVERARPVRTHFYLHGLGVVKEKQGRGIGSFLLRERLTVCDRERAPAYLECSNEKNLPLYERHGFRVVEEFRLARDAPMIWFMAREPG